MALARSGDQGGRSVAAVDAGEAVHQIQDPHRRLGDGGIEALRTGSAIGRFLPDLSSHIPTSADLPGKFRIVGEPSGIASASKRP